MTREENEMQLQSCFTSKHNEQIVTFPDNGISLIKNLILAAVGVAKEKIQNQVHNTFKRLHSDLHKVF